MTTSQLTKSIGIILLILMMMPLGYSAVHAQQTNPPQNSGVNTVNQATSPGSVTSVTVTKPTATPPSTSANPSGTCASLTGGINITDCFNALFSNFVERILSVAAFMLAIAGEILNVSMVLTLHIKDFIDATPAIFTVWQTIRDITGLFFIFFLLYAAIQMILGEEGKFADMLKNIVVAGILINFSFFIVSLGIDASNIVSQAIFNQMLPNQATVGIQTGTTLTDITKAAEAKGNISDVFMNSLQLSKLYDAKANGGSGGVVTGGLILGPIKIILIGVVGMIMMFTAAMSFIIAAGAFIIRLGILIFILAFSPIIFLSWMSPELKKKADEITGMLKNQLIFMPVYLLLMYVALSILNNSNLLGAATTQSSDFLPTGTNWAFPFIVLGINFVFVIFMLNLPLVVAIGMSGSMGDAIGKFKARNIWKNVGSLAGSRTFGRAAYSLNERVTPKLASFSPLAGSLSNSALSSVSKAGFGVKKGGYEDRLKAKKKGAEEMHKNIADRMKNTGHTDAEIKAAQASYRQSLPWKSGVLGFMLDNRAHVESQKKLDKKANDQQKKDDKKNAQKEKDGLIKEKKKLDDGTSSLTATQRDELRRQIDEKIEELDAKIAEGKEVEEKERDEKFLSRFDDLEKKNEAGGGGEKKEDKK